MLARMVPAALIANAIAILTAGILNQLARKFPSISGDGCLIKGMEVQSHATQSKEPIDFNLMGGGLLVICALFTLGKLFSPYVGISGVILMILFVTILKFANFFSHDIERGTHDVYEFMATNITPAILVGVGMLYVSWDKLMGSFTIDYVLICATTVFGMIGTTFFTARLMKMYPVECGIVCATHSGLGGSGDIAILTAGDRVHLMPFATIATRIGGALMVVIATIWLKSIS
jgi:malate:Na+ symporter